MNEYERRSITITLYLFLGLAMVVSGLLFVSSLMIEPSRESAGAAVIAFIVCALMLWLTRRKQFLIPRMALPLVAFSLAIYLVLSSLGVHDEAVMLFPLSIALAGLLLGRMGILVYAVLSIVATFGIAFAEYRGQLITPYSATTTPMTLLTVPTLLGLTALMMYLMVDYLNRTLESSRRSERELADGNQELQNLQNSLADRVAERTQRAEQARQEAENANRALEIQMWQAAGQTQLNEILRGDQNLNTLVEGMVAFLCRYLKLPVGVLYLCRDRRLHLLGGYAHPLDLPAVFELGEGLLGQAALEKRLMVVSQPMGEQLKVASGLGQMAPSHIILLPLVYTENLLGVIELGALEQFTERTVQFLERVAESLAVALHTAQTRTQLDELLQETQRQAEELQAQEEELRAANEELLAQAERLRLREF